MATLDRNDFIGSFADENVRFKTEILRTASVGDNFWTAMIFIESDRFVNVDAFWTAVPGSNGKYHAIAVDASDYAEVTTGDNLLRSWLGDLFRPGNPYNCILVTIGAKTEDADTLKQNLAECYGLMKAYAYWKTVCAGGDTAISPDMAVELAKLCKADNNTLSGNMLSAPPMYPYTKIVIPVESETDTIDPIYEALSEAGVDVADAWMVAYADPTRNATLVCLGAALAAYTQTGIPVGNSLDMVANTAIQSSGIDGTNMDKPIRKHFNEILHVGTFKPVGDNTGSVACEGGESLNGEVIPAIWIVAYVTYMTKVQVARIITRPNFVRNAANYNSCLVALRGNLSPFGTNGSGRVSNIVITAPSFNQLPKAGPKKLVIPNAWSGVYIDHVREVDISGALVIGSE